MRGWRGACGEIAVVAASLLLASCSSPSGAGGPARPGTASRAVPVAWWKPLPGGTSWQWELDHPLNLRSASDMGIGSRTYLGSPAARPAVYDIDGFTNPAGTVLALHRMHAHVICYIEVGAAESYRPDYRGFPQRALGREVPGYPAERYLDINDPAVAVITEARIAMCARKGFDAVEPDIDNSYADDTGFGITEASNVAYDAKLSRYAHSLGMAWGLKNGDEPGFAIQMLPYADFVLDEQCFQYGTCAAFYPAFWKARKAVLEVEYPDQGGPSPGTYCPMAIRDGFDSVQFDSALDGRIRIPCS